MHSDLDAPGLTPRPNSDGTVRYYWRASKPAIRAKYQPATVRLHGPDGAALDLADPVHRDFVSMRCQELQAQMIEGLSGMARGPVFDGSLRSLITMYESHEDSPLHGLSAGTRRVYLSDLRKLKAAAGEAPLSRMAAKDIKRWYKAALGPEDAQQVRSAHGLMVMLRILMSYAIVEGIPDGTRLRAILSEMRFTTPGSRQVRPTYTQARAVFDKAVEVGALSIAFGTALQFEGMLRQYDVAGVWEDLKPGEQAQIVLNGKRWNGPAWGNIKDGVLVWITGKKKRRVEIDLTVYPMIVEAMALVPPGTPAAPLIIDERSGLPYAEGSYGKRWREIADAAELPKAIWNRDFRAGGVSEGEDAGAAMTDLAKHAAHSDPNFTARVYGRGHLEAARRVGNARVKHRGGK